MHEFFTRPRGQLEGMWCPRSAQEAPLQAAPPGPEAERSWLKCRLWRLALAEVGEEGSEGVRCGGLGREVAACDGVDRREGPAVVLVDVHALAVLARALGDGATAHVASRAKSKARFLFFLLSSLRAPPQHFSEAHRAPPKHVRQQHARRGRSLPDVFVVTVVVANDLCARVSVRVRISGERYRYREREIERERDREIERERESER